jgi:large subunit ribosomal protein L29
VAKASELRSIEDADLRDQIKGYHEELFNLRFQKVTGRLTNTARVRQVKKEIARIKTVMRERQLEQE